MSDVFLSYKREDAERARKLVAALRETGLKVWWDEDIPPSAPWEATIEKALAEAKAVIVCWSPSSVASENVRSEARVAREDGRLIQVFLKPCQPPLFFGERQGVDLSKWRGDADDPRVHTIADTARKIAAGERVEADLATVAGVRRQAGGRRRLGRIIAAATIVLIVLVAGMFIAYRAMISRPSPQIAVLPFEDLSPAHDKAYFAAGVAEEILSTLAAEKDIKVLGRTTASQIQRNADPRAISSSLGVTHLLEGSARTAGNNLRINVRLIDTSDGRQLWEEEYRGAVADVFSVQDQVATAVARRLRGTFFGDAIRSSSATGINAYETYLAARMVMRTRTEASLKQALGLAEKVIRADPNYAPGHALYAELVWLLSDHPWSYGSIPVDKATRISSAHARTAIRLAPDKADGYAALGLALPPKESIAPLRRAIELDPVRAELRIWLALDLFDLGRHDEALQLSREAVAIEPLWPMTLSSLVQSLAASGLPDEAAAVARRYQRQGGSKAQYHRMLFLAVDRSADLSTAVNEARAAFSLDPTLPDIRSGITIDLFSMGLEPSARERLSESWGRFMIPYYSGNAQELERRIRTAGSRIWQAPDVEIALFYLASIHDWTSLTRLFDQRRNPVEDACGSSRSVSFPVLMALNATARREEADALLRCVRNRLGFELRQTARSTKSYAGDLEADRATLSAIEGRPEEALKWLNLAVDRGWLGRPLSGNLRERPAFDSLRSDPRYGAIQRRIDAIIARERNETLPSLNMRSPSAGY